MVNIVAVVSATKASGCEIDFHTCDSVLIRNVKCCFCKIICFVFLQLQIKYMQSYLYPKAYVPLCPLFWNLNLLRKLYKILKYCSVIFINTLNWFLLSNVYNFMETSYCGSRWKKCIWEPVENDLWLITVIILSWLNLLIFIANLGICRKVVIKCWSFETSRCYPFRVT